MSNLINFCRKQKVKPNKRVIQFKQNCTRFQKFWTTFDNEPFKSCLWISRETFSLILNQIGHHLTHNTTAENPESPQETSEICLYGL